MKTLSCKDLGTENCEFVAKGETSEEVKQKMYAHAQEAHPEKLEGMTDEDKMGMDKMMEEKTKEE